MAVFKCKMCGGTIEFEQGASVGVCDSCGTKQTLPRLDDDKKANLYDRANHFRRNNEFDKAMSIYEQILNEDNTDAESYWSLVLCRYGIEYVEDPTSHKRVPTVNRAQFTSVFADEDYKSALKYADSYQKAIYEDEAKTFDEIQKGILEISQKEEPFDVFICYKETDNSGRRTPDSVLATELYHELTKEGFKVFFSRITLEDKLGTAYEPYIFAALNSSKVMVVLGTKPEYFNAVWVKNEWSRYLALIKNGAKKMLIPAYRDMDPYDLPEEFSHLQAQDMSKLGFMQDLIRGIKKIIEADAPKQTVKETVVVNNSNTAPLLKRAFMFLEDGNWQEADDYCEKVLDIDPENAQAYLGKLMAELHICQKENLKNCEKPFDYSNNYQKAVRFGDTDLPQYIAYINERNENERLEEIYNKAVNEMHNANSEEDYKSAAEIFKTINTFKGADKLAQKCFEKAKIYMQERFAKEEAARLEAERKAEERRIAAEKAAKKRKKAFAIGTPIVAACIAFVIVLITVILPNVRLNNLKSGNYDVGDTVKFGNYHNSDEWIVLDKQENRMLLISKYALDCQPYNTSRIDVTWESCSLRKWLNDDFLNEAFNKKEQSIIAKTDISADKNPVYSTNPGNATTDKVFLLSITEAKRYFSSDSARQCKPTEYAVANGVYVNSDNGNCWWWLRSPGNFRVRAASVYSDGSVDYRGCYVDAGYDVCVRPALWINLESK